MKNKTLKNDARAPTNTKKHEWHPTHIRSLDHTNTDGKYFVTAVENEIPTFQNTGPS